MASTILIVNQKGEELVVRHYRSDVSKGAIDEFRRRIIGLKETGEYPPVTIVEGTSFSFIRHKNLFLIAATRGNPNILMIFEYLYQKVRILKAYLGDDFNDEKVTGNFSLIYELFDETMDYGYPQNCSVDVLKLYINQGNVREAQPGSSGGSLTSQITGAIDWRREGLKYRNNTVHIDVNEVVTMAVSTNGTILRREAVGKVMMKTQLTGMPECKLGLNDKIIMEKESPGGEKGGSVELDDCSFHRCVRLGKFDAERTITFIPPDGEFELMRYRVTQPSQPFRLFPTISEDSKTKVSINLKLVGDFPEDKIANNIVVKIPVPANAASAVVHCLRGRAKYEPQERAVVWRIWQYPGTSECSLSAEVTLLQMTREKPWVRAPITMEFNIPMYSASAISVRFLKVYEKSGYNTDKWVKYMTKAGDYEIKI